MVSGGEGIAGDRKHPKTMKTDHDLIQEAIKWFLASTGAPAAQIERKMLDFDQMMKSFRKNPPRPLSDAEYAETLEQMQKEAPGFLHFLLNNEFPDRRSRGDFTSKN